jgi:methylated-DNA-[protein]-cysteine S-methyltransferase
VTGAPAGPVTRPALVDYTVFDTAAGRCTIAWRTQTTSRDSCDGPGPAGGPRDSGTPGDADRPRGTGTPGDADRPRGTGTPGDADRPRGTGTPGDADRPPDTDAPRGTDRPGGAEGRRGTDPTPGPVAVVATALPDVRPGRGAVYVRRRFPGATLATGPAPPPIVQAAIDGIRTLLAGEPTDLTSVPLDMTDVPDFHQQVYAAARRIPPGTTRTYGELADELGDRALARAVGQALGRNPFPIVVPCHRVLGARGAIGGFSAEGGTRTKQRLLRIEGALQEPPPTLFDDDPSVPADRFA